MLSIVYVCIYIYIYIYTHTPNFLTALGAPEQVSIICVNNGVRYLISMFV